MLKALITLMLLPLLTRAEPLLVTYPDKPPYYHDGGAHQGTGFLVDYTRQVMAKAGIAARFEFRPAKRALMEIEANRQPVCSIGWFHTPQRAAYGHYSKDIYRDLPLVVVTRTALAPQLRRHHTAAVLLRQSELVPGLIAGFSYGDAVDQLLAARRSATDRSAQSPEQNLAMVLRGHVSYTLLNPVEFQYWQQARGLDAAGLVTIAYPDLPAGSTRYLLCSHRVDDALLARINRAVDALPRPSYLP